MSGKQVRPRQAALGDVEAAVDHYAADAGPEIADRFIDALQAAYRAIAARPAAGSPRYARDLGLPGLRTRPLRRYPYLVFYLERDDWIEIWRVLHTRRDIPARMRDVEG